MWTTIISILLLSLTGVIAFSIFANYILSKIFNLPHVKVYKDPSDFGIDYKEILIKTVHGKRIQLWDINAEKNSPVILGIHGWANSAEKLIPLAAALKEKWRVILLNARNHGKSDDDKYMSIIKYKEDLIKTIDHICSVSAEAPVVVLGHSLGGAAALLAASRDSRIKGVISIASFADIEQILRDGLEKANLPRWFVRSMLTYIEFRAGENLKEASPQHTITRFSGPTLLIHGTKDEVVDFTDMNRILKNARRENVHHLTMKGYNHSSLLEDAQMVAEIESFLEKYFPA